MTLFVISLIEYVLKFKNFILNICINHMSIDIHSEIKIKQISSVYCDFIIHINHRNFNLI